MRKSFLLLSVAFLLGGCGNPPAKPQGSVKQINKSEEIELPSPIIKVFVENSGSMDGYVKGVTDFENSVYSYLSDLQLANLGKKDSSSYKNRLELNYVNSEVLNHNSDIEEFIRKLEPYEFKMRGGNRGSSDISEILKKIFENLHKNEVGVFVSDCIFSPGRTYKVRDNADEYLVSQQIGIKNNFAVKLAQNPHFAVIIYRLKSKFDGYYFNKFDDRTKINDTRPFYIWLMGDIEQLKRIQKEVNPNKIKGSGVLNSFFISKNIVSLSYGILSQMRIGEFDLDRSNPKTSIINAKVDSKGDTNKFQLSIGVDFSKFLLDDLYLLNRDNYRISNNDYDVEIIKNKNSNIKYSHIIKLNLNKPIISKGNISISLLNNFPTWVAECTDDIGLNILADDAMDKTYGLKYLINGIYEAYFQEDKFLTFNVSIK